MTEAYPLQWPVGKPRVSSPGQSRFSISQHNATNNLLDEIRRLGGRNAVISTNVELRNDGLPYANRKPPQDRGVAIYFTYKNQSMCFACDKWNAVGDNIYAVAKTIDALRGIERWGTGDMVQQAFSGFAALPAPTAAKDWWDVLGVGKHYPTINITEAYRNLAKKLHPDNGGKDNEMADVNEAYAAFKRERGL